MINGELFENRSASFEGTVFYVALRCGEALYRFADEAADAEPPF